MIGALGAQQRRRTGLAAAAAVAVGTALVIVSSASAATPSRGYQEASSTGSAGFLPSPANRAAGTARAGTGRAGTARAAGTGRAAEAAMGRNLRTLFTTVRVFTAASSRAGIKGKISRRGTGVSVTCWTTGAFYRDVPIWYEVSAPMPGYVSAFNLDAHYAPAVGVPHCLAPVFKERFNSLEASLRVRTSPSTSAAIAGYLASVGSKVSITCYVRGTPVFDDPVWYHTDSPASGYVSGRLLNTGGDPAPGIPHC